jgi:lysozyme
LSENQFSALCSWVFNLGSGRLQSSTLRSKLNRGDHDGAGQEFLKWCMGGGRKLPGLVRRRKAELELWETS